MRKGVSLAPKEFWSCLELGDDDPEAKGRGLADQGAESTILLEEDTEEPEADGVELG